MKEISVQCFKWHISNYYLVKKYEYINNNLIQLNLKHTGRSYLLLFQHAVLKHLSFLLIVLDCNQKLRTAKTYLPFK